MKKTLSVALALVLAVSLLASLALVSSAPAASDPFKLVSIRVTDANGYANPYAALDNANAFIENQAAYVVVEYDLNGVDPDLYKAMSTANYTTTVTSSTLDLSYSQSTVKTQVKAANGTIYPTSGGIADPNDTFINLTYDASTAKLTVTNNLTGIAQPAKGSVSRYYIAFIAVTKPATAGEIKASLAVGATQFATSAVFYQTTYPMLVVYDGAGIARYTIVKLGDNASYRVFSGLMTASYEPAKYLFDFVQAGGKFLYIGYATNPGDFTVNGAAIGFTYNSKIIYNGADGILGTADDKDLTSAVNDCNTFFGFSFAYNNAVVNANYEAKTSGNPITVTDTYSYVTAAVDTGDGDVAIVPTGDYSANLVVMLAASAVLAAAALAFVARKARG